MRKLMYWIFLIPFMVVSQNDNQGEYVVFENLLLTPQPDKIQQFEQGLAAHNKRFHASDPYGVRVYAVNSGPNVGKYMWVMGPLPWSAMDKRPDDEAHGQDWVNNVAPYMTSEGDQTYWKFNPELSNFPKDFKIDNLLLDMYDVKRFENERSMKALEKVAKVMKEKYPDRTYGIYTNELPSTKDGRDFTMVFFFDDMAWMGQDSKFVDKYNEVHGQNSWDDFMTEWKQISDGKQSELWKFQPDLSGLGADVTAANRQ